MNNEVTNDVALRRLHQYVCTVWCFTVSVRYLFSTPSLMLFVFVYRYSNQEEEHVWRCVTLPLGSRLSKVEAVFLHREEG